MITSLILKIKNLPKWLKATLEIYPFLYYQFWIFSGSIILSIMHFFSFRNDIVYFVIMLLIPIAIFFIESILSLKLIKSGNPKTIEVYQAQNFPIIIALVLMIINSVMIVFSHNVFGEDAYDELFFIILSGVTIFFIFLEARLLRGRARPYLLILNYLVVQGICIFIYILSITAK
ncbi:MAG: hypothetical protein PHC62_01830 [Candidatus Izemoplasmatales bacterium]|jgi:hypothetical protein|nr:hypothetical protein [Candidatus Izemoplasmatales bacterium]